MSPTTRRFDFQWARPTRRPLGWVAFGALTCIAGAVGWYLGGEALLGIPIVGFSATIILRAAATHIDDRSAPWRISAAELDASRGALVIEETDVMSGEVRQTEIPLGTLRRSTISELSGDPVGYACTAITDMFAFQFEVSRTEEEARETKRMLMAVAKGAEKRPVQRPDTGRYDVVRTDDRTTIRWREPRLWADHLRLTGHLAFLFAATPLLDVWLGVPFAVVALVVGYFFVRKLAYVWRWSRIEKRIEIEPTGLRHEPGLKPEIAVDEVEEIGPVLVEAGKTARALVEVRAGGRWEDEVNERVGRAVEETVASSGDLSLWELVKLIVRSSVGAAKSYRDLYRDSWVVVVPGAGFREGLDLALLVQEEFERVAGWHPPR